MIYHGPNSLLNQKRHVLKFKISLQGILPYFDNFNCTNKRFPKEMFNRSRASRFWVNSVQSSWRKTALAVLAKFRLCSNCSQKIDECLLARALKIFATVRMLGFSFKCAQFLCGKTGKHWRSIHALFLETCFSRFADVLLKLTHVKILHERYPQWLKVI